VVKGIPPTDILSLHVHRFILPSTGAQLEIVTDKSQEGSQFCSGFGGIGGMLRYRVDFDAIAFDPGAEEEEEDDVDLDDYM
jgi:peptide chain release factor subunit 1